VINGKMVPIDPNSIGNGSLANVRIFQYEYTNETTNKKGIASVLMGIQVTKHIVYVPKARDDDFGETNNEVIGAEEDDTATGGTPTEHVSDDSGTPGAALSAEEMAKY
jgi:hypothetical protein